MKKRTITALIGFPIIAAILLAAPKICTAILLAAATAVGAYEILWRTGLVKFQRLVIYACLASAAVCFWSYLESQYAFGMLIVLLFSAVLFAEVMVSKGKLRIEKVCLCYFAGLVVPFFLSAMVRILMLPDGRYLVIVPIILTFIVDIGAYLVGVRFGKHKLAPVISPNKTVEGVLGSLSFGVAGMLLYGVILQLAFRFQVNYFYAVLYGILGSAASVFSDLIFSAIKRQTGLKDYGTILPGHGGVMDRLDSMVIVAPLIELLLILIPVVVR